MLALIPENLAPKPVGLDGRPTGDCSGFARSEGWADS
jgi:hypothetical protein